MSKEQVRLLKFAIDYSGWHSIAPSDRRANRALNSLAAHGLIEISYNAPGKRQFRLRQGKV